MSISNTQFRLNFPEFANTLAYPDSLLSFWFPIAYIMLNSTRWQSLLDVGAQLFVAHNCVLEGLAAAESSNGAPPGLTVGPITSKSVNDVSINYDTASGVNVEDVHWNLSNYGTRFILLARQFGSVPVQIGIGCPPPGPGFGPAWGGVVYPPNYPY